MTKVFLLTLKDIGARYAYTSLSAIFILHDRSVLGVSRSTLEKYDFGVADYENEKIIIEKMNALSTVEARKQKEIVI